MRRDLFGLFRVSVRLKTLRLNVSLSWLVNLSELFLHPVLKSNKLWPRKNTKLFVKLHYIRAKRVKRLKRFFMHSVQREILIALMPEISSHQNHKR